MPPMGSSDSDSNQTYTLTIYNLYNISNNNISITINTNNDSEDTKNIYTLDNTSYILDGDMMNNPIINVQYTNSNDITNTLTCNISDSYSGQIIYDSNYDIIVIFAGNKVVNDDPTEINNLRSVEKFNYENTNDINDGKKILFMAAFKDIGKNQSDYYSFLEDYHEDRQTNYSDIYESLEGLFEFQIES